MYAYRHIHVSFSFSIAAHRSPLTAHRLLRLLLLLWHQVPQRQVIHDILDVLDPVLQPVAAAAQAVVLEVEDLEARMQVLDELVDEQRSLVVAERDSVASKASL
jgi:hypothetical protein